MPIYEYQCEACGEHMEKLQRMSDDRLVDCPACGKPALKRLVSAAAFRLKGGGWYETDFKKDNKRNLADSGSGNGSSGAAHSSPASESKSAASGSSADGGDKKANPEPAAKSSAGSSAKSSAKSGSD